jgi:hypothetical protein
MGEEALEQLPAGEDGKVLERRQRVERKARAVIGDADFDVAVQRRFFEAVTLVQHRRYPCARGCPRLVRLPAGRQRHRFSNAPAQAIKGPRLRLLFRRIDRGFPADASGRSVDTDEPIY